jgi:xylan 1,4-beta-xylosidase
VTSDTIDGEWSEPIYLNSSGFDPSLFHDEDGKKYLLNMLWDPRVGINSFAGTALQEYCPVSQKLVGEVKNIFTGTWLKFVEGPHVYQKDGYYYLVTAEGATEYFHAVTVARSKNLAGPYEVHPENPILTAAHAPHNYLQKNGHASFVETPDGEWYLAHLTSRPIAPQHPALLQNRDIFHGRDLATQHIWQNRGYCPLGRESALQKLTWRDGWPYVVGGIEGSTNVDAPTGVTETKWEPTIAEVDNFESPVLNRNFATLRIPFTDDLGSLTARPNHLRLYGRESLTSKFTQSLVARRWQSFQFEAETAVAFNPTNVQQGAGLTCFYNTENWSALQVRFDPEIGRIVELTIGDNFNFTQPLLEKIAVPTATKYVYFKVNVDFDVYYYSYSFDGTNWTKIERLLDATKLSDDYVNGPRFTGAFVGMNCDDMGGTRLPADFKYFRYSEK